jgi:glyoxylase-like metal-dependent hydrolase (beta-lactamase superfamily II)
VTVHCFPIETPWTIGRVNVYLIEDDPLTLFDTGPNTGTALEGLTAALASVDRRIEDLERIVISHQHADHCGLLGILAERSGAEVVALDLLAPWLEHTRESMTADDANGAELMLRHGVPETAVITLRAVSGNFRAFGSADTPVARTITDGGTLAFGGRTLQVHHRPGHSPTDTILHDEASGDLFGGDHLLRHMSSNPIVTRGPLTPPHERPHALLDYIQSMRATAAMAGVTRVLTGHGDPITDVGALVERRLTTHDRRARSIGKLLEDGVPRSAHAMAGEMWGATALTQAFLTLSQMLGYLDMLIERGEVVEDGSGDLVLFRHA